MPGMTAAMIRIVQGQAGPACRLRMDGGKHALVRTLHPRTVDVLQSTLVVVAGCAAGCRTARTLGATDSCKHMALALDGRLEVGFLPAGAGADGQAGLDRKSTRLNSSH